MKERRGDLLSLAREGHFDVIIHGCNCFCSMGGGIARQIREQYPQAYQADCRTTEGDRSKLGSYSSAWVESPGHSFRIVNGYTQYHFYGAPVLVDYGALEKLFSCIKRDFTGLRLGYPKIGAGLAGGDWARIAAIIEAALEGEDHTLVNYAG